MATSNVTYLPNLASGPNYSAANSLYSASSKGFSDAGTVFGKLRESILNEEQREWDRQFKEAQQNEAIRQFNLNYSLNQDKFGLDKDKFGLDKDKFENDRNYRNWQMNTEFPAKLELEKAKVAASNTSNQHTAYKLNQEIAGSKAQQIYENLHHSFGSLADQFDLTPQGQQRTALLQAKSNGTLNDTDKQQLETLEQARAKVLSEGATNIAKSLGVQFNPTDLSAHSLDSTFRTAARNATGYSGKFDMPEVAKLRMEYEKKRLEESAKKADEDKSAWKNFAGENGLSTTKKMFGKENSRDVESITNAVEYLSQLTGQSPEKVFKNFQKSAMKHTHAFNWFGASFDDAAAVRDYVQNPANNVSKKQQEEVLSRISDWNLTDTFSRWMIGKNPTVGN